jgi:hypothetical protein
MPLNVGTLVRPFVDASYFTKETDTNFQCDGGKTDVCVGIIVEFLESTKVTHAMVKWLQKCEYHKSIHIHTLDYWHSIDDLWEIGQIY